MPPSSYVIISKDDLLRKYQMEGWAEKLSHHEFTIWNHTPRKTLTKWFDGDDVIAFIIEYSNPTGKSIVVRQLRDGDTMFFIP